MISAVAARKAALAIPVQHLAYEEPIASSSGSNSPLPSTSANRTPKRKNSTRPQNATIKHKKPRKMKPFEKSNGKRMEEDGFREQADVIAVDLDSDEGDDDMSMLDDSDDQALAESITTKRPWSPSQPMEDSSDEDSPDNLNGGMEFDVTSLLPHPHRQPAELEDGTILSTFQPTPDTNIFYLDEEEFSMLGLTGPCTLICLNDEDSLCILGTCAITIIHGSISLCGAVLPASSTIHPVFAPRSSPLPIIRPSSSPSPFSRDHLPTRLQGVLQFKAALVFQELITGVEGLGNVCRTFDGVFEPSRWQRTSVQTPFKIPGLYMVARSTKDLYPLSLPFSWTDALESISVSKEGALSGAFIIKGPKNSGKSTFARSLINRLLRSYRRVAFLECDIGQSEFTPGGMVSLNVISKPIFGPPFTHPTLPNFSHFIGATTPRSSPSYYLEAVSALIQTYRLDIQTPMDDEDDSDPRISHTIPFIVNTMGWVKGLGADLTQAIENMLEPTAIIDIHTPSKEPQFPVSAIHKRQDKYNAYNSGSLVEESIARIYTIESISQTIPSIGYTAADHRNITILSYFHVVFPQNPIGNDLGQVTAQSWDTTRPLCAIPPFEVECSVAFDKIVVTGAGSEDVVVEEIGRVLNGAVVGLISCEPGTIDDATVPSASGIPYTRHHAPPLPASSNCVGLALIRGISPPIPNGSTGKMKTYIHLLTPLPHSLLSGARVLVKGEMELPIWGMLDYGEGKEPGDVAGVDAANVPFLQWGKGPEGVIGAERRRVRRNLMRKAQM